MAPRVQPLDFRPRALSRTSPRPLFREVAAGNIARIFPPVEGKVSRIFIQPPA